MFLFKIKNALKQVKLYSKKSIDFVKNYKEVQYVVYTLLLLSIVCLTTNLLVSVNINTTLLTRPTAAKIFDFLLVSLIFYPLFLVSKNKKLFFVIEVIAATIYYAINAIKYLILLEPIRYGDLFMIDELYTTLPIIFGIIFTIMVLIPLAIIIYNTNYKSGIKRFSTFLIFPIFIVLSIVFSQYIENAVYKNLISANDNSYKISRKLGNVFYLYYDMLKNINQSNIKYSEAEVKNAIDILYKNRQKIVPNTKRNIFLIAIESLDDIDRFLNEGDLNRKSFSDEFYNAYSHSRSVSYAIRKYTANGVYELLCGIPLMKDVVLFNETINNDLPCLPNELKNIGYLTNSYMADMPNTFNFGSVLGKIGFRRKFFLNNVISNVVEKQYLSDYYLLNFALEDFRENYNNNRKTFNFILTVSSHIPYLEYKSVGLKNKIKLRNKNRSNILKYYLNSIYYSTELVSKFVNDIFAIDPNAFIVITGDHPALSLTNGRDKELEKQNNEDLYAMSLPLIVYDGKDNLLTDIYQMHFKTAKNILNLTGIHIPIFEYDDIVYDTRFLGDGKRYITISANEKELEEKLQAIKVLFYDVFYGEQYYRKYI